MYQVALLGFLFIASHFLLGWPSVRGALVRKLGEGGFMLVYNLLAAVLLWQLVSTYNDVNRSFYWWYPDPSVYWISKVLMWVAMVLFVGAFAAPNPSSVGAGEKAKDGPQGMLRVTRHPLMWAIGLWAISHIIANGDAVSVLFFGTFAVLALVGAVVLDAKKAIQLGDDWREFSARTSLVPFAAVLGGRTNLVGKELLLPIAIGSVVYVAMLFGHRWLSGVDLVVF